MFRKIARWIDERSGLITLAKEELYKPLPKGVGWAFSLGSLTLSLLILQMATGFALALYYAPTPDHAYESVQFIQKEVLFGRFLRSLHHYTASGIVITITLHLLRVLLWGAYKRPRELTWVIGIGLFLTVMGFAFTGYLLPWDQKAYWATVVGTEFTRTVPFIGPFLLKVARGGETVGALTLTRFYAVHTMLLPALLITLIGLHLYLIRKLGIAGPWTPQPGEGENFYPYQVFRDVVVAGVVIGFLAILALARPAGLEPMANPTDSSYIPRPEWYFLSLYQLLKYLPGPLEFVGVFVIPGVLFTALLLLPWLDRGPERHPLRRPIVTSLTFLVFATIVALTAIAIATKPPQPQGEPVQETVTLPPTLIARGKQIYTEKGCANCHSIRSSGGQLGPPLDDVGLRRSQNWLEVQITQPQKNNPNTSMPAFPMPKEDLQALITYLMSLRGQKQ